jgi:rapamycin-insensitive companion of mTOR
MTKCASQAGIPWAVEATLLISVVYTLSCSVFDGTAPPHFYGELTKTAEGCRMLEEKGHFAEFAQFIRQHGLEAADKDVINKLKSILWAVVRPADSSPSLRCRSSLTALIAHALQGSIGATSGGFPFLEGEDLLVTIVEIAEQSPVLSVRG